MTGGEIVVFGRAGAETGACMRRGLIAVAGDVGPEVARGAIAGTVVVGGNVASGAGLWSKRGTVVALGEVVVPATYRVACAYRPPYVALLLTTLRRTYAFPVSTEQAAGSFRRYCGDLTEGGRGEILEWAGA
jgi:formylmethanofuran dehydrogenase subunit C